MNIIKNLIIFCSLMGYGCVSSTSYEDLERRVKLANLEASNAQHERARLASDLKAAKAAIHRLERQLSEQRELVKEQDKAALSDHASQTQLQADLLSARAEATHLKAMLTELRTKLTDGSLNSKAARQKAAADLDAATLPRAAVSH